MVGEHPALPATIVFVASFDFPFYVWPNMTFDADAGRLSFSPSPQQQQQNQQPYPANTLKVYRSSFTYPHPR